MALQPEDFCYCNFDDERIDTSVETLNDIYTLHLETYRREPVFFLDEIQLVSGWEKFINRMYEQGRKIFVTGSNAHLLSSEISTSLTGRNKVIKLWPFSFSEFLRFRERDYDLKQLSVKKRSLLMNDLKSYLDTGGFPLVVKEGDLNIAHELFQDILYRDIVARFKLSNVEEIKQIGLYLASNIGKLFSYNTLLKISGAKSLSSIKDYLHYYQAGYLFYYLRKFDYSVKKQIMNSRKVYTVDNAIANRLGFRISDNYGRLLENCIFTELCRRGHELFYFSRKHECDFLVKENLTITEAIQVVYNLTDENSERELAGLQEAMAEYNIPSGTVIFMETTYNMPLPANVRAVPAYLWLMESV
jgi:predicted AAA+ superfamily ATPase